MTAGKKHPDWLSPHEVEQIHQALVQAETGTKGEIIPIVVEQAQAWRHVGALIWLMTLALGLALLWQFQEPLADWTGWSPLNWIVICGVMSFGLAVLLRRWPWCVRLFVSPLERTEAAHLRAELEFSRRHFDRSAEHATIVMLVAVLERKVVLLVEPELKKRIPEEVLQNWLNETTKALAQGFRDREHSQGMRQAILKCGELLKKYAPGPVDYRHEFPAEIVYIKS